MWAAALLFQREIFDDLNHRPKPAEFAKRHSWSSGAMRQPARHDAGNGLIAIRIGIPKV
jgi:hypothetical protein